MMDSQKRESIILSHNNSLMLCTGPESTRNFRDFITTEEGGQPETVGLPGQAHSTPPAAAHQLLPSSPWSRNLPMISKKLSTRKGLKLAPLPSIKTLTISASGRGSL